LQRTSPLIDLSVIEDIPVSLIIGEEDYVANEQDGNVIFQMIGNTEKYMMVEEGWNHASFEVGNDDPHFIGRVVDVIENGRYDERRYDDEDYDPTHQEGDGDVGYDSDRYNDNRGDKEESGGFVEGFNTMWSDNATYLTTGTIATLALAL